LYQFTLCLSFLLIHRQSFTLLLSIHRHSLDKVNEMSVGSQPSQMVPATKKRSLTKFEDLLSIARDYNLGNEARRDLSAKGEGIIRKAKPALFRHATEHGVFSKTWAELSNDRRARVTREMNKLAPWLLNFEETWATEWVAKRLVNQRVYDQRRPAVKRCQTERTREGGKKLC
jgi:hypothetical protein